MSETEPPVETDARTVLITGCSSGIGHATALAFLDEGWTVYATARDTDDIADLTDRGCVGVELDVTDLDECAHAVARVVDDHGHIDCLVNNAGYAQLGAVEDIAPRRVHAQFDVNVYGPHRLSREALPHMREAEAGRIVNVSSVVGRLAIPGGGVYSASKFALEAMSDALRAEVRPFDVDVVMVEPGPVGTKFDERAAEEMTGLQRTGAYEYLYRAHGDFDLFEGAWESTAEEVADVILDAATISDPSPRLPVGTVAQATILARHVPAGWRDLAFGFLRRVVG